MATTAMLSSPATSWGKLAMAPLVSFWRSEAAARESIARRLSSPPRTSVLPWSLSLVASTAPPALSMAS